VAFRVEYFRQKNRRKKWRFWLKNTAESCEKSIVTLFFFLKKNAIFFAENCNHNIGPLRTDPGGARSQSCSTTNPGRSARPGGPTFPTATARVAADTTTTTRSTRIPISRQRNNAEAAAAHVAVDPDERKIRIRLSFNAENFKARRWKAYECLLKFNCNSSTTVVVGSLHPRGSE
jgi:hypothetical protein